VGSITHHPAATPAPARDALTGNGEKKFCRSAMAAGETMDPATKEPEVAADTAVVLNRRAHALSPVCGPVPHTYCHATTHAHVTWQSAVERRNHVLLQLTLCTH
jgi:hypothetical protein